MKRSTLVAFFSALLLGAFLAGCPEGPEAKREICGNGLDDDGNGDVDCADIDCKGQTGCPGEDGGINYGTCAKCGTTCTQQSTCVVSLTGDRPLPQCTMGSCYQLNQSVQVNYDLDFTSFNGVLGELVRSLSFRTISKKAIAGTAVTCATLEQLSKNADGGKQSVADWVEQTGKFNTFAVDVFPLMNFKPGKLPVPLVSTGTGSDYVVWVEGWTAARDSTTRLPTGNRIASGCVDMGDLGPITGNEDCNTVNGGMPNPGCKTIKVEMGPPEM